MENLTGAQGFLLLHQHLRHMDWSKITKGVTQPEYLILTALHVHHQEVPDSQGIYVSALGEELSVSVSMISKLLRVLEEKGWILRTVDKNSRRNTFVTLTELGESVYQTAPPPCSGRMKTRWGSCKACILQHSMVKYRVVTGL